MALIPEAAALELHPPAPQELYALSPVQEGMLFHALYAADPQLYFSQFTLALRGSLDEAALRRAWERALERHPVLRTTFAWEGVERPVQVVHRAAALPWEVVEWGDLPPAERQERRDEYLRSDRERGFDLARGPLTRVALLRTSRDEQELVWSYHHLLLDGWSVPLLLGEVFSLYRAHLRGGEAALPRRRPYRDYVAWLERADLSRAEAFWRGALRGVGAPTSLSVGRAPGGPAEGGAEQGVRERRLGAVATAGLRSLARGHGVTAGTVLQAAWALLLSRYVGEEDVVFGITVSGRPAELEGADEMVGLFINTLPLRVGVPPELPLPVWLGALQEKAAALREHEHAPLVQVQQWSGLPPGQPLFENILVFENFPVDGVLDAVDGGFAVGGWESFTRTNYPLTLVAVPGARLTLRLKYDAGRFDTAAMERLLVHLGVVLEGMAAGPGRCLSEIPLLPEDERRQLLAEWNRTEAEYPRERCLHEAFAEQAARTPGALAVVFRGESLTYAELDRRANQLARALRRLGVGPEVPVGLCMERSVEMIVGVLGTLKAGGAYLPLDPAEPGPRLGRVLEDAAPSVLLTQARLAGRLPASAARVLRLDADWAEVAGESGEPLDVGAVPENLAYVIYTSGSTGRPRGVLVQHRSVLNLAAALRRAIYEPRGGGAAPRVGMNGPLTFDTSVKQLVQLLSGCTLHVLPEEVRHDGSALADYLRTNAVEVFDCTPAQLRVLLEEGLLDALGPALTDVLVAGEALDEPTWRRLARTGGRRFYNLYGPTECTVDAALCAVHASPEVPVIGWPIANTALYVLGADLQPVPMGVAGELYVGGACLARGYLGRPGLSGERFLPDPFTRAPGARMYRTGDRARRLGDGALEFLGRVDFQVKVRGHRVEPGEIEAVLLQHPGVRVVAVLAREDVPGEARLVAYHAPPVDRPAPTSAALREHLRAHLPGYMVPSAFVALDALPLTPHGKLDRKALPAPEPTRDGTGPGAAPRTPLEEILAGIWAEVLGVDEVGIHADFFALGGHSLLATRVISRVRGALGVEAQVRALFDAPSVALLSERLERELRDGGGERTPPILRVPRDRPLPLSFAQQRLWFLDQLEPGSPAYHMPAGFRVRGELDPAALRWSLGEVVRRHESLRTRFPAPDGHAVQEVVEPGPVVLRVVDLCGLSGAERERERRRLARDEAERPFDLARGPLLRTLVVRLGEADHGLFFTMHHIAGDGWSTGVLVREVSALYGARARGGEHTLPELPVQYADYAAWQRKRLTDEVLEGQLAYWRGRLAGAPPLLDVPTDFPRPPAPSPAAGTASFQLPGDFARLLRGWTRRESATLFVTLLSAFQALLSRYGGQEDVCVGTPVAGRTRVELEPLVGLFVNTLVLRGDLSGDPSFRELVARLREAVLDAHAHQDLPFERLVDELKPERSIGHTPLFQAMLVVQNASREELALGDARLVALEPESASAKFDLVLEVADEGERLSGRLTYRTALFRPETAGRMLEHFRALLTGALADPQMPVGELPLLGAAERAQLLVEWNGTEAEFPRGCCIHELFEAQVARAPEAAAVVFRRERLTYGELNVRADRLARALRARGVVAEVRVGICLERSPEMLVALLAVLKAGGAYVPLDPTYPRERLAYLVQDSGAAVLLTREGLRGTLPATGAEIVCTGAEGGRPSPGRGHRLRCGAGPESLAYVVYTSGSTGAPKGVAVSHRSVCNYVHWINREVLGAVEFLPATTRLSFDASVKQLWGPLLRGAAVWLLPEETAADPAALLDALGERGRAALNCVPSLWSAVLRLVEEGRAPAGLGALLLGGEALGEDLVARTAALLPEVEIWNLYGPTEATVNATACRVGAGEVTIGRPIANARAYVLDRRLNPVPVRVAGELCIGGEGVARGYLGRPALTAERFVPDPFGGAPGARLYRTGDRARWLPGGELEFMGRLDEQVKVRGFRIEPGEIEAVLRGHSGVREAVVAVREDAPGHRRLVAYVVAPNGAPAPSAAELRAHLGERLPEYMVPSAFVVLEALPLTPTGKVDRAGLPAPERGGAEHPGHVAPRTAREEVLARIWCELLRVERVGVHDNFFTAGGDSILCIQVVARARKTGLHLTPRQIFEHPTVAALARVAGSTAQVHPEQGVVRGEVPLTPIQRRFFEQVLADRHHWNQAFLFRPARRLDPGLVARAVGRLTDHHDALRLRFALAGGEWTQRYAEPGAPAPVVAVDLARVPEGAHAREIELVAGSLQASLDLEHGPLVRVGLFDLGPSTRLLVAIHHLVVDGVSWRVLLEDLVRVCERLERGEEPELPPKTTSYGEWAERLAEHARSEALRREAEYWTGAGRCDAPHLPVDRPGGVNRADSVRHVTVCLGAEETDSLLKEVPAAYSTQINDVLLTALVRSLAEWTGDRRIRVDLEGHGREDLFPGWDLSRTVGWFTTLFPVSLDLRHVEGEGPELKAVKEQLRGVPGHGIGYGLLRYLSPDEAIRRELRSLPAAEIGFNYLGQFDQTVTDSGLAPAREPVGPVHGPAGVRAHLLNVNAGVEGGALRVRWSYSRNLHREETVARLAERYLAELRALIAHCCSDGAGGHTPSDFPLAQLDEETLAMLEAELLLEGEP